MLVTEVVTRVKFKYEHVINTSLAPAPGIHSQKKSD